MIQSSDGNRTGGGEVRAVDPRPARTRQVLFDALLELIQEKRWDRIRVQDILHRTGIGRSTFYAHFDNKFDLLTAAIPDLLFPIEAEGHSPKNGSDDGVPDLLSLFEHVVEMQPVMRAIMSQPLLGEIMDSFHRQLAQKWTQLLAARVEDPVQLEFVAEMLASGFMAVNRKWLAAGCERPAAAVCRDYRRYAAAIIAAADRH